MSIEIDKTKFTIGINWGPIKEMGWFNTEQKIPVDLDLICFEIDRDGLLVNTLSFELEKHPWGKLSQDDMSGDLSGDDHRDNEWIEFDLEPLTYGHQLVVGVINYTEQSLCNITHFDYRIYTGEINRPKEIFYYKNIKREIPLNYDSESMILGCLERLNGTIHYKELEISSHYKDPIGLWNEMEKSKYVQDVLGIIRNQIDMF